MPYRKRFDALIFDLDGTVIDTAPDLRVALNVGLEAAGFAPVALADVRAMIGDGVRKLLERGMAAAGHDVTEADLDRWTPLVIDYYSSHIADSSRPFPGVVQTLEEVRRHGIKTAICTNKPVALANKLIEVLGMTALFDAVLGGDSLPVKKPDPGHVLGTLQRLGTLPARAAMIGDSGNDALAARNAGIPVILVGYGYTSTPVESLDSDAVVAGFDDIIPALNALA
jgi:phosphoglycolate phosphatase